MRSAPRPVRRRVEAVAPSPAPAQTPAKGFGRALGVLAALALIALATGSEAYVRDPAFAARVAELASATQAKAQALIQSLAP
jgi:hypothetical protein